MEYEVGDLLRYDGWKNKESIGSHYCIVVSKTKTEFDNNYYEVCWIESGTKSYIYSTTPSFKVVSK